ncbi:MAG: hypothetical protein ACI8P0_000308 [Planctomycetaceae bacterium]
MPYECLVSHARDLFLRVPGIVLAKDGIAERGGWMNPRPECLVRLSAASFGVAWEAGWQARNSIRRDVNAESY